MESIIIFKDVLKRYKLNGIKKSTLKELLFNKKNNKLNSNIVLNNISFEIKSGESLAIIGKNGVGKSTILKLITKIVYPDSGIITVNGKVCSLLELGAGFVSEYTGRQNIYFNASIYGMSKKDVNNVIDSIIDFSEIKEYIDEPIRTYSSGMYMRLAFSVAIHMKANILIIDELLAVGDKEFQKKCMEKLLELKKNGVTIIVVSHDMENIVKICDRVIWIEEGLIKMDGKTDDIIKEYLKGED